MRENCSFVGSIIKSKGNFPVAGSRLKVEFRQGMSFKEEIVVRNENGFLGYPDTDSYCKLFESIRNGKTVTVEILEIKKEGICDALFVETSL